MDPHRSQSLADLREAVLSADFSLQMANTVVEVNQDQPIDDIESLTSRYLSHGDELEKTRRLVDTYNSVAAEEMAAFKEEAMDIVYDFLSELAEREGWDYQPPPNPYRR